MRSWGAVSIRRCLRRLRVCSSLFAAEDRRFLRRLIPTAVATLSTWGFSITLFMFGVICPPEVLAAPYSFTSIDVPFSGAVNTQPFGINASGQIVGGYCDPTGCHGFLDSGGSFSAIDVPFAGPSVGSTVTNGIDDSGQIVGVYWDAAREMHGFLATPAGGPSTQHPAAARHGPRPRSGVDAHSET
jgi:hypothetical protein